MSSPILGIAFPSPKNNMQKPRAIITSLFLLGLNSSKRKAAESKNEILSGTDQPRIKDQRSFFLLEMKNALL